MSLCSICYIIYISKYGICGIRRKGGFPCRRAAVLIDSPGVLMCTRISKTNFFGGYCISHNPYPIQCVYDPICQHAKFWTACTLSDAFNTLMFSFFCCAGISEKADQQKRGDSKDLMVPILGVLKSITRTAKLSQIDISMRLLFKQ